MEMITEETNLEQKGFYWRQTGGVRALVCAPLEEDGFTNGFSTRLGGVSPFPENSLNLAGFNEDAAEHILENRRRFLKLFSGQWTLTGCWQVHGADVRLVKDEQDAQPVPGVLGDGIYCDALVSAAPRVLIGVKTADCVPILLGDPKTGAFAAVHAGWRGTVAAIVINALERMTREYGARAEDVRAAIGPAAAACCYEVGEEVITAFKERFPESDKLFTPTHDSHALIDLFAANRAQLISAGVAADKIHTSGLCTMCRTDLFFSYRREKKILGKTGRLMAVIGSSTR
jgi:YfiH family protein